MAFGRVLFTWHDSEACDRNYAESKPNEKDRTWAAIQITRAMTAEENPGGWQSDGSWNDSVVVAYRMDYRGHGNKHRNEWRAEFPGNNLARKSWSTRPDNYAPAAVTAKAIGSPQDWEDFAADERQQFDEQD